MIFRQAQKKRNIKSLKGLGGAPLLIRHTVVDTSQLYRAPRPSSFIPVPVEDKSEAAFPLFNLQIELG
jgi:hypothetical protein